MSAIALSECSSAAGRLTSQVKFPAALERIAGELLHQHIVTYLIPAASKSDGRLSITPKRKGLTLRGPNRVPEVWTRARRQIADGR